ncbi:hypothetical protein SAMN05216389_11147 [Oceanobacillus limi]|uniref:Uncharacterized protein n=1 Tax=Oceanobacillus limi TaxID=930131 RepID=A0A1I0EF01_9BACI|nr:hypothetical protein [Oceanobacillus limi]SET43033.1 hypothetical protein SAMN05216389_11147 [Oceanobacillus limi]
MSDRYEYMSNAELIEVIRKLEREIARLERERRKWAVSTSFGR